jgi:hypothetical protein
VNVKVFNKKLWFENDFENWVVTIKPNIKFITQSESVWFFIHEFTVCVFYE